jgi:UDP-2,3-diacylglucosamine hydrolase
LTTASIVATYFLSDLHLPPEVSPLRQHFLSFVEGRAGGAEAVYVLGDLFEYWIGDDVGMQVYAPEVAALTALTARGVPVWFQHGNRDFLVGREFSALTGVALLDDPAVVDLYGTRTLVSHGDRLCTDDVAYQRWRRFSRFKPAQWVFHRLPVARRERIAGGLRSSSDTAKANKPENIMDVNADAVAGAFAHHRVARMIHGHTHRPAEHRVGDTERIVLADWQPGKYEVLEVDAAGLRRVLV